MNKTKYSKLFIRLISAILIFNQAVFLLGPINFANAQTNYTLYISSPSSPVSGTIQLDAGTNTDNISYDCWIEQTAGVLYQWINEGGASATGVFSCHWDTTQVSDGGYYVVMRGYKAGEYFQNSVYLEVNNSVEANPDTVLPDLTYSVISPTTSEVSGQTTISVQTNIPASPVSFNLSGFGRNDKWSTDAGEITVDQTNNIYSFILDTTSLENGGYSVWINAAADKGNGQMTYINNSSIEIIVNNSSTSNTANTSADTTPATTESSSTGSLTIDIITTVPSIVSGVLYMKAVTNESSADVKFSIVGPATRDFVAEQFPGSSEYNLSWDTTNYPDGTYTIYAKAYGFVDTAHESVEVIVDNIPDETPPVDQTNTNTATSTDTTNQNNPNSTVNTATSTNQLDFYVIDYLDAPLHGDKSITIFVNQRIDRIEIHTTGTKDATLTGIQQDSNHYYLMWHTQDFPDGDYNLNITVFKDADRKTKTFWTKIKNNFENFPDPYYPDISTSTEPHDQNQYPDNITIDPSPYYPPQNYEKEPYGPDNYPEGPQDIYTNPTNKPIGQKQPPTEFYDPEFLIPWECKEKGITDMKECEIYFFKSHLPYECKEAGVTTIEECDKIMMTAHMPRECQEKNILNYEECDRYLRALYISPDCTNVGITDPGECEKHLFINSFPPECVEANILDEFECEKHMFKDSAPDDCREAGIMGPEACRKYMFEKYGGGENIPTDKYPPECIKAGAQTIEECEKVMQVAYMPRECKELGIESENECEIYLTKKHMPQECQDEGATTKEKCDKIMFKKFAPKECVAAGIIGDQECKEFMINKYKPNIECYGLESGDCDSAIKDRHIGDLVSKQNKFEKLKEKTINKINETVSIAKLKEYLGTVEEIIPIINKGTKVKIVKADQKIILDEEDNLIQTSPIVLMIDSDQDGLSDDFENRLGTNPNNPDSDGDGYGDGEELKNDFNPFGDGGFKATFAPIEEALLNNETLGQPKTDGELEEDLKIEEIKNLSDTNKNDDEGYALAGKAEANSIITLYIYSDLPLVVTTKVDRYGNWEYELNKSLIDGEHEIYVVLNDNTGKVISKSNPLNFFVKEAKAISVQDFVAAVAVEQTSEAESLMKYYIIIASLVIMVGILLFVIFIIQKRKRAIL